MYIKPNISHWNFNVFVFIVCEAAVAAKNMLPCQ